MNDFDAITNGLNINADAVSAHQDAIDDICGMIDDNEFSDAALTIIRLGRSIDANDALEILNSARAADANRTTVYPMIVSALRDATGNTF